MICLQYEIFKPGFPRSGVKAALAHFMRENFLSADDAIMTKLSGYLSWIEDQTSDLEVAGSNPAPCEKLIDVDY